MATLPTGVNLSLRLGGASGSSSKCVPTVPGAATLATESVMASLPYLGCRRRGLDTIEAMSEMRMSTT